MMKNDEDFLKIWPNLKLAQQFLSSESAHLYYSRDRYWDLNLRIELSRSLVGHIEFLLEHDESYDLSNVTKHNLRHLTWFLRDFETYVDTEKTIELARLMQLISWELDNTMKKTAVKLLGKWGATLLMVENDKMSDFFASPTLVHEQIFNVKTKAIPQTRKKHKEDVHRRWAEYKKNGMTDKEIVKKYFEDTGHKVTVHAIKQSRQRKKSK